jgi:hypothetical protein
MMVFSPYKSELTPGGDFQMKAVGNLDEMVQGSYLSFSIDRAHVLLDNTSWGERGYCRYWKFGRKR